MLDGMNDTCTSLIVVFILNKQPENTLILPKQS